MYSHLDTPHAPASFQCFCILSPCSCAIACLPCSKLSAVRRLCEAIAITVANVFFTRWCNSSNRSRCNRSATCCSAACIPACASRRRKSRFSISRRRSSSETMPLLKRAYGCDVFHCLLLCGLTDQCDLPNTANACPGLPYRRAVVPPLSRFARRAGFVAFRQTFVRRCQNYEAAVIRGAGRCAALPLRWKQQTRHPAAVTGDVGRTAPSPGRTSPALTRLRLARWRGVPAGLPACRCACAR